MSNDTSIEKNEHLTATPEPKPESKPGLSVSRRRFLTGAAGLAAGTLLGPGLSPKAFGPFVARAATPGKEKLNLLFVAADGRAGAHRDFLLGKSQENCLAYAEVDTSRTGKIKELAPNAVAYTDWRSMMDAHLDKADAVVVATPDHSHAIAALRAIMAGKAVYCEKPLTWSIEESRLMAEASTKMKVATQMGNQGHAKDSLRTVVEVVRSGIIGDIIETHTWTDRSGHWWPQGNLKVEPDAKPDNVNWDVWLGPAAERPYQKGLHPFAWRGWFDFGCGAVGDMGCHTWDSVFWALQPDYPSEVELIAVEEPGTFSFAKKTHFKWTFPAKGARPGFVSHWYSNGLKPPVPEAITKDTTIPEDKRELPIAGCLYIGTKGSLLATGDYSDSWRLIPRSFMEDTAEQRKNMKQTIRRLGAGDHYVNHMSQWVNAAKGNTPWDDPDSKFSYAGPLTEVMLLGSLAERVGEPGFKFQCDPVKREILTPRVKAMRSRQYRKGFELPKI